MNPSATSPELTSIAPTENIEHKLAALRSYLRKLGSVVVGYSGGVDSALVALVAWQELGPAALAVLGVSPSLPAREYRDALDLADRMGFAVRTISTNELARPGYVANAGDRCYHCRVELFSLLAAAAQAGGFSVIADGHNRSDAGDYRPGRRAAAEYQVRSPLWECGFSKDDIRAASRLLGLPVWSKPAAACLSSRIPHGTTVTPQRLRMIELAEEALKDLGFEHCRVRHHEPVARIEVSPQDIPRLVQPDLRGELVRRIKLAGYAYVAVDLEGYSTGSLNKVRPGAGEDSEDNSPQAQPNSPPFAAE